MNRIEEWARTTARRLRLSWAAFRLEWAATRPIRVPAMMRGDWVRADSDEAHRASQERMRHDEWLAEATGFALGAPIEEVLDRLHRRKSARHSTLYRAA